MDAKAVVGTAVAMVVVGCGGRGGPADAASGDAATPAAFAPDLHFIGGTFSPTAGPDGNTVIFEAPGGLVVVDAGRHATHSQKILDYAAERGMPIATIVNTHWHLDHATGNQDLKAVHSGARLYTTGAVEGALDGFLAAGAARTEVALRDPDLSDADRARLERGLNTIRGRTSLLPDVPVDRTMSLPVTGRDLELNVTHHAVTESDVWIWDPATRTVVAGDLVTLPAPLFDTGCPTGWLAALDAIESKPYERLVPGHGFIMSRAQAGAYRTAFKNLVACAEDNEGAVCAEGWLADAGPLLDQAVGEDYGDRAYARAAVEYYVDEVIRSAERRAEFCGASQSDPPSDTLRLEVGSPEVDGRFFPPHRARNRVYIDDATTPSTSWTNELLVGDSAGRQVMRWISRSDQGSWELLQTYDARSLAPLAYRRTAGDGSLIQLRIDGTRVTGVRRDPGETQDREVDTTLDRAGFIASASDLVPMAVRLEPGLVMTAPVWGPNMDSAQERIFTVIDEEPVTVEGEEVTAWRVEERIATTNALYATWWITLESPYMVLAEIPLANGGVQRITGVDLGGEPR